MTLKYTQKFLDLTRGYEKPGEDLAAVRFETRECDCALCKRGWVCTTTAVQEDFTAVDGRVRYHHPHKSNVEAVVPDVAQPESDHGADRPCATEPAGSTAAGATLDTRDPQ